MGALDVCKNLVERSFGLAALGLEDAELCLEQRNGVHCEFCLMQFSEGSGCGRRRRVGK